MPKLHVHIGHHFFGAGNLGDDLMLAGFLAAARPTFLAEVKLTCCIPHEAASQRLRFPEIEWLPYDDATRQRAIAQCDLWLGLGDTPFQIVVGAWFLDHLTQEAAACRQHGKPMFYLGVGLNEHAVLAEPRMRTLVGQAEKIWARDEDSAAALTEIAEPGKVAVGADLAHIALSMMRFAPPAPDTLGLLLNFEDPSQYRLEEIAALVDGAPGPVAWLAQEIRPLAGSESALHAQLPPECQQKATLRISDYAGAPTPDDLLRAWGVPAMLCTSRYHGALTGAWMGCRTVAFARSAKVVGGARQLGLPLVDSLADGAEILQLLAATNPVPRPLLQANATLARAMCDAFFSAAASCRARTRPSPAATELASVSALESLPYTRFMARMNEFAAACDLRKFTDWSKVWEYPWLWTHGLRDIRWPGKRLVDLGSEISPMPWFLATLGARVTLVETDPQWVPRWEALRTALAVDVDWHLVDSERLPLADAEADVLTSFSVIEHQPDKRRAMDEVARVLKPGGLLAISFDICEADLGMTFPAWNGRALTLREFEEFVWNHSAFAGNPLPAWNLPDMADFRRWHLRSAPHHNYVVGAAALTRRGVESALSRDSSRNS